MQRRIVDGIGKYVAALRRREIESDFHVDIEGLRHIFFARIRAVPAKRANAAQRNRVAQNLTILA